MSICKLFVMPIHQLLQNSTLRCYCVHTLVWFLISVNYMAKWKNYTIQKANRHTVEIITPPYDWFCDSDSTLLNQIRAVQLLENFQAIGEIASGSITAWDFPPVQITINQNLRMVPGRIAFRSERSNQSRGGRAAAAYLPTSLLTGSNGLQLLKIEFHTA